MTENEPKVYDSQIYHDFREMPDVCQSVNAQYGTGGNNMPFVVNERVDESTLSEDQVASKRLYKFQSILLISSPS